MRKQREPSFRVTWFFIYLALSGHALAARDDIESIYNLGQKLKPKPGDTKDDMKGAIELLAKYVNTRREPRGVKFFAEFKDASGILGGFAHWRYLEVELVLESMERVFERQDGESEASMLVINIFEGKKTIDSFVVMPDAAGGIDTQSVRNLHKATTFFINGWKRYEKPKDASHWKPTLNHTKPTYIAKDRLQFRFSQDERAGRIRDENKDIHHRDVFKDSAGKLYHFKNGGEREYKSEDDFFGKGWFGHSSLATREESPEVIDVEFRAGGGPDAPVVPTKTPLWSLETAFNQMISASDCTAAGLCAFRCVYDETKDSCKAEKFCKRVSTPEKVKWTREWQKPKKGGEYKIDVSMQSPFGNHPEYGQKCIALGGRTPCQTDDLLKTAVNELAEEVKTHAFGMFEKIAKKDEKHKGAKDKCYKDFWTKLSASAFGSVLGDKKRQAEDLSRARELLEAMSVLGDETRGFGKAFFPKSYLYLKEWRSLFDKSLLTRQNYDHLHDVYIKEKGWELDPNKTYASANSTDYEGPSQARNGIPIKSIPGLILSAMVQYRRAFLSSEISTETDGQCKNLPCELTEKYLELMTGVPLADGGIETIINHEHMPATCKKTILQMSEGKYIPTEKGDGIKEAEDLHKVQNAETGESNATSFLEVHSRLTFQGKQFSNLTEEEHVLAAGMSLEELGFALGGTDLGGFDPVTLMLIGWYLLGIAATLFVVSYIFEYILLDSKTAAIFAVAGLICVVAAAACFAAAIGAANAAAATAHQALAATPWWNVGALGAGSVAAIGADVAATAVFLQAGAAGSFAVLFGVLQFTSTMAKVNDAKELMRAADHEKQSDMRVEHLERQLLSLTEKVTGMDQSIKCNAIRVNQNAVSIESLSEEVTAQQNELEEVKASLHDAEVQHEKDEEEIHSIQDQLSNLVEEGSQGAGQRASASSPQKPRGKPRRKTASVNLSPKALFQRRARRKPRKGLTTSNLGLQSQL